MTFTQRSEKFYCLEEMTLWREKCFFWCISVFLRRSLKGIPLKSETIIWEICFIKSATRWPHQIPRQSSLKCIIWLHFLDHSIGVLFVRKNFSAGKWSIMPSAGVEQCLELPIFVSGNSMDWIIWSVREIVFENVPMALHRGLFVVVWLESCLKLLEFYHLRVSLSN
jgi:hypothetical protein